MGMAGCPIKYATNDDGVLQRTPEKRKQRLGNTMTTFFVDWRQISRQFFKDCIPRERPRQSAFTCALVTLKCRSWSWKDSTEGWKRSSHAVRMLTSSGKGWLRSGNHHHPAPTHLTRVRQFLSAKTHFCRNSGPTS